jgi:hypothetical protein
MWRLIALAKGWNEAFDYDGPEPILVVWHPTLKVHYSGSRAWWHAAHHREE